MRLSGKTILVTGGLGFIGSHFVRELLGEPEMDGGVGQNQPFGALGRQGRVLNIDCATYAAHPGNVQGASADPRYEWRKINVADEQAIREIFSEAEPEIVVNFAAESHVDRSVMNAEPFVDTNVKGVQVLLEAALAYGVERFVQVSTDEVYGDVTGEKGRTTEDAPLRPNSPYSATKAAADHLCRSYRETHGLPVILVRPSNNYGPNQHPEKLIPLTIRRLLDGGSVPLYGDGRQVRDWLFVKDCIAGILRAAFHESAEGVYNLATGQGRENREVVGELCSSVAEEVGASRPELVSQIEYVDDRPGHDRRYAPDPTRAQGELDWAPQVDFEEGIRRTVLWYLNHSDWVQAALDDDYQEYAGALYEEKWAGRKSDG